MRVFAVSIVAAFTALVAGAEIKQSDVAAYNAAIGSSDIATQLAAAR